MLKCVNFFERPCRVFEAFEGTLCLDFCNFVMLFKDLLAVVQEFLLFPATCTMRNFTVLWMLLLVLVEDIVQRINQSLDKGSAEETHKLLQKVEGKFPTVRNRSALLYHNGLREVKQQLKVTFVFLLIGFTKAVGLLTLFNRKCCYAAFRGVP